MVDIGFDITLLVIFRIYEIVGNVYNSIIVSRQCHRNRNIWAEIVGSGTDSNATFELYDHYRILVFITCMQIYLSYVL